METLTDNPPAQERHASVVNASLAEFFDILPGDLAAAQQNLSRPADTPTPLRDAENASLRPPAAQAQAQQLGAARGGAGATGWNFRPTLRSFFGFSSWTRGGLGRASGNRAVEYELAPVESDRNIEVV